jgi:hypothetical protein
MSQTTVTPGRLGLRMIPRQRRGKGGIWGEVVSFPSRLYPRADARARTPSLLTLVWSDGCAKQRRPPAMVFREAAGVSTQAR